MKKKILFCKSKGANNALIIFPGKKKKKKTGFRNGTCKIFSKNKQKNKLESIYNVNCFVDLFEKENTVKIECVSYFYTQGTF